MDIKHKQKTYVLNTYNRVGPVFIKGKGSWLWDESGKKYLDLFPGWGVSILGHCHPRITGVIREQAGEMVHLPNNLYHQEQALAAQAIVESAFPGKVFFGNSGAEANELAIKMSRLYGRDTGRYEIITMHNSFHGRTFGAMSATGQDKYRVPFKPLVPGFKTARFNDFADFKNKVTKKTVGVMLELVQGEGGVNIADKAYVKQLYDLCRKHKFLFIVDEVQTGMARTGKMYAYQNYGIIPDMMSLSKGLGAGIPIGALVVHKKFVDLIKPGLHASTFGGGPLASRVCREVYAVIKDENLLENARQMGEYLAGQIRGLKSKCACLKEVRGVGLMVGAEFGCETFPIFQKALDKGLIVNSTHGNVLRIMPALNVTKQELDKGIDILAGILAC